MIPPKSSERLRSVPKNTGLLHLIRAKRERMWKPSMEELRMGFRGWHQRGYLPHFDAPNVTQMVTFNLADSFPIQRRAEWEPIFNEADDSLKRRKLEAWLDRGHGACWLRQVEAAEIVEEVLRTNDGEHFKLRAWVIMPNHVPLVVDVWDVPLSRLIDQWKGKSARLANQVLKRTGKFWQEDYFDTLVRDAEHFKKAIRYTEDNPAKAKLLLNPGEWPFGSARLRDKFNRLPSENEGARSAAFMPLQGGTGEKLK